MPVAEAAAETPEPDWSALFTTADLDPAAFTPTTPTWTPLVNCDTRAAWLGAYPETPEIEVRIEAGAFQGRPVSFRTIFPWMKPPGAEAQTEVGARVSTAIVMTLFLVVPVLGGVIAWRHLRAGRGDRRRPAGSGPSPRRCPSP